MFSIDARTMARIGITLTRFETGPMIEKRGGRHLHDNVRESVAQQRQDEHNRGGYQIEGCLRCNVVAIRQVSLGLAHATDVVGDRVHFFHEVSALRTGDL